MDAQNIKEKLQLIRKVLQILLGIDKVYSHYHIDKCLSPMMFDIFQINVKISHIFKQELNHSSEVPGWYFVIHENMEI